jgi:hypothetical protein
VLEKVEVLVSDDDVVHLIEEIMILGLFSITK